MNKIYHIVGTDTEIGKTYVCCQLINCLNSINLTANGIKPLASGLINGMNPDVSQLANVNYHKLDLDIINPYRFNDAIAPHIAAKNEAVNLNANILTEKINNSLNNMSNDITLIEGVGGVMTPLNTNETYLDILHANAYPIILVVGIKLGCLNHAMLTVNTLLHQKLPLIGWIANYIDNDMPYANENVIYLQNKLNIPCLAQIKHNSDIEIYPHFKELLCN